MLLLALGLLSPVPAQPVPVLRPPERLGDSGWRLAWSGETGRVYRVDRAPALPPIGVPDWQPVATVTATNGLILSDDLIAPEVETRFYRAVLVTESAGLRICATDLNADSVVTNGTEVLVGGRVRAGMAAIRSTNPIAINLASRQLSAAGELAPPNGLTIAGSFVADLDTAKLLVTGDPTPFGMGQWLGVDPRELTVNLNTGALSGSGIISVRLQPLAQSRLVRADEANPSAILEGAFESGAETNTLNFAGTASYRDVTAEGMGTIAVSAGTFSLDGKVRVPGAGELPYLLEPGRLALVRPADLPAEFSVAGQSALAPAGTGQLAGRLQLDGSLALAWTGPAEVGALRFSAADRATEPFRFGRGRGESAV